VNVELNDSIREVTRDDLFATEEAEEHFWDLAREQARASMPEDEQKASEEWFEEQLDDIDNLAKTITFTETGVEVTFDRHAFGPQLTEVSIPYAALAGIISPRYLRPGAPGLSLERTLPARLPGSTVCSAAGKAAQLGR
jgi:hypothetical protein